LLKCLIQSNYYLLKSKLALKSYKLVISESARQVILFLKQSQNLLTKTKQQ